ncbi:HAMP domain-containing sensor histidine kinase [Sphaerisporangium sp. NPDC051011]|uniref:sensor histidine kinase n=1 Tax=Sphaerisporangium sp. NPDC051011 TaxID=3155792 RepID=UPI0033DC2EF0
MGIWHTRAPSCDHIRRGRNRSGARRNATGASSGTASGADGITAVAGRVAGGLPAVALITTAALAARAAGRKVLRRVSDISAELAAIYEGDAGGSIAPEHDPEEIAELVRHLNVTLQMLSRERGFTSDVSHELRSPITALRAELDDALLYPGQTDVPTLTTRLLPCVDRLEAMVTDLLTLARSRVGRAGRRERFDLDECARQVVSERLDRCPVTLMAGSGVTVDAVPAEIRRALVNLLDNAQRYARKTVDVEVRRQGGDALLAVSDDGEGVPEADRRRIFERFTRLDVCPDRDGPGTGLGLAITQEIARGHGGSIHVEDSETGGARFVLRLPLSA